LKKPIYHPRLPRILFDSFINKNTALLRCSWAFEKQTKLKQTDYCQWVRPTDFVKRSKEN